MVMMGPDPARLAEDKNPPRGGIIVYGHHELCAIAARRNLTVDNLLDEWKEKRFVRSTNPAPEMHAGKDVEF